MPDKKLTDNEIKKALECCVSAKHICPHDCPMLKNKECLESMRKNALDLINRLQAENERLSTLGNLANVRANDYRVMRDRALKAEAENERLKKEFIEQKLKNIMRLETSKEIEAEAYKEFADKAIDRVEKARQKYQRLCKEQGEEMEEHMQIHFNGIIRIIKKLLKELVGDA